MVTDASRAAVEDAVAELRATHGAFPLGTERKRWDVSPSDWERDRERFEAGTLGGAGAWVRRDDGAALLVRREGDSAWADPGGKQEPGEPLAATAARETREETGVRVDVGAPLTAHRTVLHAPDRPPLHRLIVVFEATLAPGADADEIRPEPDEIAEVRWVHERPEDLLYPEVGEFPL